MEAPSSQAGKAASSAHPEVPRVATLFTNCQEGLASAAGKECFSGTANWRPFACGLREVDQGRLLGGREVLLARLMAAAGFLRCFLLEPGQMLIEDVFWH